MNIISKELAYTIYDTIIERYGGEKGVNPELLDLCLETPYQTFHGQEIYNTISKKAACYLYFIISLHPFTDGNKRMGFVLMRTFLLTNGYDIKCSEDEMYTFVISIAENNEDIDSVTNWVQKYIKELFYQE